MNSKNSEISSAIELSWPTGFMKLDPTYHSTHIKGSQNPVLIKDSWEEPNDSIEGMFLKEATEKKVECVARYLHHETLSDLEKYVRIDAIATRIGPIDRPENMFLRRVITRDEGNPIFSARTVAWYLRGIEGGIRGCMSLYHKAGIIHGNISMNNIMINDKSDQKSLPVFLMGLDCAIRRNSSMFIPKKPAAKTFRSINALKGQKYSFMDDMESFFWVTLWTITHVVAPSELISCRKFDHWRSTKDILLANEKSDLISRGDFEKIITELSTPMYKFLVPYLMEMRDIIFIDKRSWIIEDENLPNKMMILTKKYMQKLENDNE